MKKTVAIEINGVLRNFLTKFILHYQEKYPERLLKKEIDEFNIKDSFYFKNDEYKEFVQEYAYELYSKSQSPDVDYITELNKLSLLLINNNFRVVLINVEGMKSRTLTSFYISNFSNAFYYDQIRYYLNMNEYVDENFDFLITKNPKVYEMISQTKTKVFLSQNLQQLKEITLQIEKNIYAESN